MFVVDDSIAISKVIGQLLSGYVCCVDGASNGVEAMNKNSEKR
ncbi:MAG: hypothetical protein QS748_12810 [Candidatus Endonucleobacter bathymodioli]|uniref:Response regulatory domain-containing protein n=1 Tax=Candidatus Endonucleibacter bathymodioli TaxID=539814 RepID=A0AA90SYS1_9GAMM|nr:hypothetical protein [Candidatus Endonucleobacter bathymodioli]